MAQVIADRVKESTQTTGTGPLALLGAAAGYQAFSAVCSVNDTVYYAIEAVDANGIATGAWEVGLGTYSGASQLTRTTPQASSNAGSAVNFGAGTKNVWIDASATYLGTLQTTAGLASPPAIGGTTPAAGTFNPLNIGAAGTQVTLQCDVANQLSQRNGVSPQMYISYNTFTDGSNYERGQLGWNGNALLIGTQAAGTGSMRNVQLNGANLFFQSGGTTRWTIDGNGAFKANPDNSVDIGTVGAARPRALYLAGAIKQIGGVTTSGVTGIAALAGTPRLTAQAGAANLTAVTVGAADASYIVSANVNVTTATTHSFNVTCSYTDETNTGRVLTLNFATLAGVISNAAISNVGGTVPYEGVPMHIRCKAATTITIGTTGTFTTVAYNLDGLIQQLA